MRGPLGPSQMDILGWVYREAILLADLPVEMGPCGFARLPHERNALPTLHTLACPGIQLAVVSIQRPPPVVVRDLAPIKTGTRRIPYDDMSLRKWVPLPVAFTHSGTQPGGQEQRMRSSFRPLGHCALKVAVYSTHSPCTQVGHSLHLDCAGLGWAGLGWTTLHKWAIPWTPRQLTSTR